MSGIEWVALGVAVVAVAAFSVMLAALVLRPGVTRQPGCPRCSGRGPFCSCIERCGEPECKARKVAG